MPLAEKKKAFSDNELSQLGAHTPWEATDGEGRRICCSGGRLCFRSCTIARNGSALIVALPVALLVLCLPQRRVTRSERNDVPQRQQQLGQGQICATYTLKTSALPRAGPGRDRQSAWLVSAGMPDTRRALALLRRRDEGDRQLRPRAAAGMLLGVQSR